METSTLSEWLLQRWEVVLCASALALLFVSVRIGVRFDVNAWVENRAQTKQSKER